MNQQTDLETDEQQLKDILVNLKDEHTHLRASIEHLQQEITKRELKVKKLQADRQLKELKFPRSKSEQFNQQPAGQNRKVFSSEFSKQVAEWLNVITRNSEEISALSKL